MTDPLIVHIATIESSKKLVELESGLAAIYDKLAETFWPGPLTLVTKANLDVIPTMITANTGYVGVRMPNHPVALDLISRSGFPIAAPSANKFGHVSPTKAEHVYSDF